ncbi:MAG: penicillin-binding protein [Firmicutes bacterium]|nr:penicillin-binding protein [Bacillota bacterium]
MQKKAVKKKSNNTNSKVVKKTTKAHKVKVTNSNTNNSSRNYSKKRTKQDQNIQILCWIGFVALTLLCYLQLGLFLTVFTVLGIGVILFVSHLLKKYKHDKKKRRLINFILILILSLGILGLIALASFLLYITASAPKFDTSKLKTSEVTIIYDKNEKQIAKLGSEMREKVTYDQLPEVLVDAIVATEDSRFFQHNGFDAPRFIKATAGQLGGNSDAGGASTLSMQVIKNSFTSTEASGIKGIIRKFTDIYLAVFKLEKKYSKEEIIEYYVNNHFLGGNIYGVEEAANAYFGKDVSDLNLSEAATLAGMFKSPNFYRPTVNPKNATARRKTVLYLMRKHGYITAKEEKIANSIPIESLTNDAKAEATNKYQGYIDTVVEEVKEKYGVNAYVTPLKIYTNMDPEKQDAVNKVLSGETYEWINDKVQTGVSVLDSDTGKILAIGNGRNRSGANSFNYATQIKRQPGSTAKPLFDYGPGIEYNNWSTYEQFDDAPYSYSNGRSIKNWDGGYYGTITLRRALSTSRNIPALKAFQKVENKKISNFVTSLGIIPEICPSGYQYDNEKQKCINPKNSLDTKDTISLHEAHSIGAFTGVSPLQMSAAYAAFSNGGYYNEPYSVSKIIFRDNGVTKEHKANKKRVMSDATAFMISSVLQDVQLTGGTPNNVACKTGTTNYDANTMNNNNLPGDAIRDSWVVGYSTKTVIGMWYGYDFIDSEYCLRNLPATIQKDRLFNALVRSGAMESNRSSFKQPSSVVKLGILSGSNPPKLAAEGSGNVVYEYFKKGHEPSETATEEKLKTPSGLKVTYDNSTNKVTLSWTGVSPLKDADKTYGTFGYNIYIGSTLIDFTTRTSYTYTPGSSPYGTYKIIATYKGYSGAQSGAATFTLKEEKKEEPVTPVEPEPENPENPGDTDNQITP